MREWNGFVSSLLADHARSAKEAEAAPREQAGAAKAQERVHASELSAMAADAAGMLALDPAGRAALEEAQAETPRTRARRLRPQEQARALESLQQQAKALLSPRPSTAYSGAEAVRPRSTQERAARVAQLARLAQPSAPEEDGAPEGGSSTDDDDGDLPPPPKIPPAASDGDAHSDISFDSVDSEAEARFRANLYE